MIVWFCARTSRDVDEPGLDLSMLVTRHFHLHLQDVAAPPLSSGTSASESQSLRQILEPETTRTHRRQLATMPFKAGGEKAARLDFAARYGFEALPATVELTECVDS